MWDTSNGMGTVTHQSIGYLVPMGPYYWLAERIGLPDWVAQRLWLGTLIFLAGAGVVFLLKRLRWSSGWAIAVAAFAYCLSPYLLDYAARISAILMPWSALGWMIGLAIGALRRGGWRDPAIFALVVLLCGGVNATSLIFAGVGPLLWFPYAVFVERSSTLRRAFSAIARIGVLTLATSLWWIAGLWAQGRYGLDILAYTETYETVAKAATAPELLRGLGYWFFYGGDALGPWIEPGAYYTTNVALIMIGYAVPIAALVAACRCRWRERVFFVGLVFVGLTLAVGAHPFDSPTLYGKLFKAFSGVQAGNALRSTPRAVPLVTLGLAVLLGAAIAEYERRVPPRRSLRASALALVVIAAGLPPLWIGQMYGKNLQRDESIPSYWTAAAAALDAGSHDTRVLEIPGSDFASYRWGNTVDPITPGLIDRPYVARELIPYGSAASADLLNSLDRRFQEGIYEAGTLSGFARLISAGTIALRSDLQYERYATPRPRPFWLQLTTEPGLSTPRTFGTAAPSVADPRLPLVDEVALATPPTAADPPPVALFDVANTRPIVHTAPATGSVVLAGDGDGIVDAIAAGVIDPASSNAPVFYAAASTSDEIAKALASGGRLVVTDTNRKQARRWGTVRENLGYTETAAETPLVDDPTDNRLPLFPKQTSDDQTVTRFTGIASVMATGYGNPVSYTPEDRPANALDGDIRTAWNVGAFSDVTGEKLVVTANAPVTTDHVMLLQSQGVHNRWMTRIRLHFDDGSSIDYPLGDESTRGTGQSLDFPPRTFTTLTVEVLDTNIGLRPNYTEFSGVGIAELTVEQLTAGEIVRLPTTSAALTEQAATNPVTILLSRLRSDPARPVRTDPEPSLARTFLLGTTRTFTIGGVARLDANAPDELIDALTGRTSVLATSSAHLPGDADAVASSAIDDDVATAWQSTFLAPGGSWVRYVAPTPITFDHLDLAVFADGRHSVPTSLNISVDDHAPVTVTVPAIDDQQAENAVAKVRVALPAPLTGRTVKVTVAGVRSVTTIDYYARTPVAMPVAIAELGIAGLATAPATAPASACRDDLLIVDATPYPVRLSAGKLVACGPAVELAAGEHVLRTATGRDTGIDIDHLLLDSPRANDAPAPAPTAPMIEVRRTSSTEVSVDVAEPGTTPFWLVLGESNNAGWRLELDGTRASAGARTLVDGYANAWLIAPNGNGPLSIRLTWAPQRTIWAAITLSALAAAVCLAIVTLTWRRRNEIPDSLPRRRSSFGLVATVVLVAAIAVAAGVFSAVIATGTAVLVRKRPLVARWLPASLLATAALYIVARQVRFRLPAGFEWPGYFEAAHQLGLAAVAALVVVVVTDRPAEGSSGTDETG